MSRTTSINDVVRTGRLYRHGLRRAMATQLDTHFSPEDITFAAKVTYLNEVSALILCDPDQMMLLCLEGQYTGLSRGILPWKQSE